MGSTGGLVVEAGILGPTLTLDPLLRVAPVARVMVSIVEGWVRLGNGLKSATGPLAIPPTAFPINADRKSVV